MLLFNLLKGEYKNQMKMIFIIFPYHTNAIIWMKAL